MDTLDQALQQAVSRHPSPDALKYLSQLARTPPSRLILEQLSPQSMACLADLFYLGGAVSEWMLFNSKLILELTKTPIAPSPEDIAKSVNTIAAGPIDWPGLRLVRRILTLRIAAAEISPGLNPPPEINCLQASALLSTLSAAIMKAALNWLDLSTDFAVIALGKLGGWELNYSSDIDLLYLAAQKGHSFETTARILTRELEAPLNPGRLFRVDLRLRPYGRSGALVPSMDAAVGYYKKRGRSWERQAFIRACHLAGDESVGSRFLEQLDSFIWDQEVSASSINDLLELRKRTVSQVKNPERHLKQGPGGIREIEFVVQFLQMLHGAKNPSVRVTDTCSAIDALAKEQIIWPDEAKKLREAYIFQRSLEHLLQLRHDREEEIVPTEPEKCSALAFCSGLTLSAFETAFSQHREDTQSFLASLLQTPFAEIEESEHSIQDIILQDKQRSPHGVRWLEKQGFEDGQKALKQLFSLCHEKNPFLAPPGRARTLLAGLTPTLIKMIKEGSDPDRALKNLALAADTLGAKATFLQLLLEKDDSLKIFIRLAETSDFLIQTLARQPGVLDEVLDRLQTRYKATPESMKVELDLGLQRDDPIKALGTMKSINTLHVGIHDLSGRYNVQNTGRDLSLVAEAIISGLLSLAYDKIDKRHNGRPQNSSGEQVQFSVLTAGKLGGREITYGSDYDLIFIHESSGLCPDKSTATRYFHHVVQEMIKVGSTRDGEKTLAPIDPRLRPAGSKSLLSCSLSSAVEYYSGRGAGDRAANWERLALTKLRPIAGDPEFGRLACQKLGQACDEGADDGIWDEVILMRERQKSQSSERNLKLGWGGLADIEFVCSALSLCHRQSHPTLAEPNTAILLSQLNECAIISPRQTTTLLTAYQYLRSVNARLRVLEGQPGVNLPKYPKLLRSLALRLGYIDTNTPAEKTFNEELAFQRNEVQLCCGEIIHQERIRASADSGREPKCL
jgi:[glutamine synthetase] adenylyltransferase / [glutamine synthetase]-adenylyl-L-tyrosine phosphorylase